MRRGRRRRLLALVVLGLWWLPALSGAAVLGSHSHGSSEPGHGQDPTPHHHATPDDSTRQHRGSHDHAAHHHSAHHHSAHHHSAHHHSAHQGPTHHHREHRHAEENAAHRHEPAGDEDTPRHRDPALELVKILVHGHGHGASEPDHEHPVHPRSPTPVPLPPPAAPGAVAGTAAPGGPGAAPQVPQEVPVRWSSSPLFVTLCTYLI